MAVTVAVMATVGRAPDLNRSYLPHDQVLNLAAKDAKSTRLAQTGTREAPGCATAAVSPAKCFLGAIK